MNEGKTEVIVIGGQRALRKITLPERIYICGADITIGLVLRDLGVYLDRSLTLDHHIARICSMAFVYLRIIGRVRQSLTPTTRMTLIHALVVSRINFGACLLSGVKKANITKLQSVLRASIRVAHGTKTCDIENEMRRNGWLTVENIIKFRLLCLAHKVCQTGLPKYLAELLLPYEPCRTLRSSLSHQLHVPAVTSMAGERGFSRVVPKLWNSLPLVIRSISQFDSFRKALHRHLTSHVT